MRVWLNTFPAIGSTVTIAREVEQAGFFGILLTDSQCLAPDPFVELALVAQATDRLHVGTCATNAVTRHPTVLAGQAATLMRQSAGRMHVGLARGDSSVSKIGLSTLTTSQFAQAITDLRTLLSGAPVEIDDQPCALGWLGIALEPGPPPVLGVASGPETIRTVAVNADGLILQVGSDPDAARKVIASVRAIRPQPDFRIAVYVIVSFTDEGQDADAVQGVTPLLARMATATLRGTQTPQARAAQAATGVYSLATHGLSQGVGDSAEAARDYAISGTVVECRDQLLAMADTGCDELVVILGSMDTPVDRLVDAIRTFGVRITPHLATRAPAR